MPVQPLTKEQQDALDLKNKTVIDYMKEGKTLEEAKALVEANRTKQS